MAKSSTAGKRRGKPSARSGSSVAAKGGPRGRGGVGVNRSAAKPATPDGRQNLRPGAPAPRVEPSTRGAKQWTGGRRNARKAD
ncbi:MAG TPA: hypothetical protein VEL07_18135 [Planctomycetota bacterium]|nr:hypothetical protein [Planctomycetota bacterium]